MKQRKDHERQPPAQITIKLKGGLGNQLWQYAAAMALYAQHADRAKRPEVWVDITRYKRSRGNRSFLLKEFFPDINVRLNTPPEHTRHREPRKFTFSESFLKLPCPIVLEGHFQHYRYVELAGKLLKPRLPPLPNKYKQIQKSHELVALHVSYRNFINVNHQSGLAPLAYYKAALAQIQQQVKHSYILVFSDNVSWVREHLQPVLEGLTLPYAFPDQDEISDFSLMMQCRHFIVANSAFGNMAALLGSGEDSLVFVPKMRIWLQNISSKHYLPAHWKTPPYLFHTQDAPKDPLVSVIIPVYNTYEYLDRCLESVCCQTEQHIEIIIVDDASPDNSWMLIQEYAAIDPRIVAIQHKQNMHLGGARNTGIKAAQSEYLIFIDSDDYIRSDMVEIFLQKAHKYPDIKIISCRFWRIEGTRLAARNDHLPNLSREVFIKHPFEAFCTQGGTTQTIWNKLWKKSLFVDHKIFFEEGMSMEDLQTAPRLIIHVDKILLLPQRLYFQQKRTDSIMANSHSTTAIKDFGKAVSMLMEWGQNLPPYQLELLRKKLLQETLYYVRDIMKNNFSDLQNEEKQQNIIKEVNILGNEIKPLLGYVLINYFTKVKKDRWPRFIRLPWIDKLNIIAKALEEKIRIYPILRPVGKAFFLIYKPRYKYVERIS